MAQRERGTRKPPRSSPAVIHSVGSRKHPPILAAALTPGAPVKEEEEDFRATDLFTSQLNGPDPGECVRGCGQEKPEVCSECRQVREVLTAQERQAEPQHPCQMARNRAGPRTAGKLPCQREARAARGDDWEPTGTSWLLRRGKG